MDSSLYIEQSRRRRVSTTWSAGGAGGLLTVLIFLLNFRSTFISGLVLPTSIIATFMMMAVMGFTINIMTLMAL